jgi:hypothetical protein
MGLLLQILESTLIQVNPLFGNPAVRLLAKIPPQRDLFTLGPPQGGINAVFKCNSGKWYGLFSPLGEIPL